MYRVDASSRELRQTITVGDGPTRDRGRRRVTSGWRTLSRGTVSRIDTDSNELVGEPIRVGNGPTAVAFGEGSVWVTNVDDQTVSRIDPGPDGSWRRSPSMRPAAALPSARLGLDQRQRREPSRSPRSQDGRRDADDRRRQRPERRRRRRRRRLGREYARRNRLAHRSRLEPGSGDGSGRCEPGSPSPRAMTRSGSRTRQRRRSPGSTRARTRRRSHSHGGPPDRARARLARLWVAAQAARGAHRGGTLRVEMSFLEKERDPAVAYDSGMWNILNLTNDGLVGFKNVGGGEGAQVVPNLATSMPTPTDGGKTYAFRLRPEIGYSNGARMKASDVRASFERLFKAGTPVDYFTKILGGSACLERPKACDLSHGIVTDDEAGTVTFHLTGPTASSSTSSQPRSDRSFPPERRSPRAANDRSPRPGPTRSAASPADACNSFGTGTSASGIRSRGPPGIRTRSW